MTIALLSTPGDFVALAFWLLFAGFLLTGLTEPGRRARRAARDLERGRRTYPASHGAGPGRWPAAAPRRRP